MTLFTKLRDTIGATDIDNPRVCSFCHTSCNDPSIKHMVCTPDSAICNECTETVVYMLYAEGIKINMPSSKPTPTCKPIGE